MAQRIERGGNEYQMIEVKVRFWTNDIPEKGKRTPKHAWSSGMVRIDTSRVHGFKSKKAQPFHSLLDLPAAIERVLLAHGVVLHPSRGMKRYFAERERT